VFSAVGSRPTKACKSAGTLTSVRTASPLISRATSSAAGSAGLAYLLPRDEPIQRRVVESELATASAVGD
jgi:hypothetical protein